MPSLTSCQNHPRFPAVGVCPKCGVSYCERCMTYRGSRYICKGCASSLPPEPGRSMAGAGAPEAEAAAEEAESKRKQPKQRRSRYDTQLAVRRIMKRVALFTVLGIGIIAAYLPLLMNMTLENTYSGAWLDQQHASRIAVLNARVHLLYQRPEEAISILEESLEKLPEEEQDRTYLLLATIYMEEKDTELAKRYLEYFLSRWPRHEHFLEAGEMLAEAERIEGLKQLNEDEKAADVAKQNR